MSRKNYTIEHYGNNRQDWLANRGFGGSSVSALFGKNKYMNALDIYCAVINPSDEKNDKQTASTIHGTKAEYPIAEIFALHHTEYELEYPTDITMYRRKDYPYMTYTADAILKEKESGRKGIYEGKTRVVQSKAEAEQWRNGILPEQYVLQVLQGLVVITDAQFIELCVELIFIDYDTGKWKSSEIRSFHLERKDVRKAVKVVQQKQIDFYQNHIETMIPPNLEIEVLLEE